MFPWATNIHDEDEIFEDLGIWTISSTVFPEGRVENRTYVPYHVAAIHEVMHIEETHKNAKTDFKEPPGKEVIPTLRSLLLLDEINKTVSGIDLETDVD